MTTTTHTFRTQRVETVFEDRPSLLRTSYANQRGLAARYYGSDVQCLHGTRLDQSCTLCRASGCVLLAGPGAFPDHTEWCEARFGPMFSCTKTKDGRNACVVSDEADQA